MSVAALVAEHGSPLWLADVDRARERLAGLRAAWSAVWPDVEIAYSYKTNRTTAFLRAFADDGAGAEVVCAAEYALARDVVGIDGSRGSPSTGRPSRTRCWRGPPPTGRWSSPTARRSSSASRSPASPARGCASACPDRRERRAASASRRARSSPPAAAPAISA